MSSILLPLAGLGFATITAYLVFSPNTGLVVTSAFGLVRALGFALSGFLLVATGTGIYWFVGILVWGFGVYAFLTHSHNFADATDLRAKINP
jgi:hypothetical protein